ncbi:hypothetical protein HK101_009642 [Irineochytrium annulatum]|nr:hypothetical protein HK101_009642 [Irineochytrium annulatum]
MLVRLASTVLLALLPAVYAGFSQPLTVDVGYAQVTGFVSDKGVVNWLGIPYAVAPINDLRFKAPVSITTQLGSINANAFGPGCPQIPSLHGPLTISEDCLYLNVYAPKGVVASDDLPVMVWIHGGTGGFTDGSADQEVYDPTHLLEYSDVIFVSINYRLGAFGWLASDSLIAEGNTNVGLLDQRMALQWVKTHIAKFGGNPNKVTAWGQMAGAISIATHLFTAVGPVFDQAIIESGPVFFEGVHALELQPLYKALALEVGCPSPDASAAASAITLACLRSIPAIALAQADVKVTEAYGYLYQPIIDGVVLLDKPINLAAQKNFASVPVIVGTTVNEGTIFTGVTSTDEFQFWLAFQFPGLSGAQYNQIITLYGGLPTTDYDAFVISANIFGDAVWGCSARALADALSTATNPHAVYKYQWNYVPNLVKKLIEDPRIFRERLGIFDGAEIPFVFNNTRFMLRTETAFGASVSQGWVNFATTGDPNVGVKLMTGGGPWPEYKKNLALNNGGGQMLRFDGPSALTAAPFYTAVADAGMQAKCQFWNDIYSFIDVAPQLLPV